VFKYLKEYRWADMRQIPDNDRAVQRRRTGSDAMSVSPLSRFPYRSSPACPISSRRDNGRTAPRGSRWPSWRASWPRTGWLRNSGEQAPVRLLVTPLNHAKWMQFIAKPPWWLGHHRIQ